MTDVIERTLPRLDEQLSGRVSIYQAIGAMRPQQRSGPNRSAACRALLFIARHPKTSGRPSEPLATPTFRCRCVAEVTTGRVVPCATAS